MRFRQAFPLIMACIVVSPMGTVPEAHAQVAAKPTTVRAQLPPDAQRSWDRATEAMRANLWATAVTEFQRAYDLSQNPRVLYNVGVCEKELQHFSRAASKFEQGLREGEGKLSVDERERFVQAIAIVRRFVGKILVASTETGATLTIDDYEIGKTPFTSPVDIDLGAQRVLRLRKEGFREQTLRLDIAQGVLTRADFRLEPLLMASRVGVEVRGAPNATVYIDGTDMGPSPFRGDVPAGRHTFEARAQGYVTATQTSEVVYREPLSLVLSLSKERKEAKVRIEVQPDGALIEIDGKVRGATSWEGVLPPGGHQLIVKKTGYEASTQELALQVDQERTVRITLLEDRNRSWIWWTIGAVAVVGAGTFVSYIVFKPSDPAPYTGTFGPGVTTAHARW
jgi:hypothetical protein